jgi:hypothetical protein
VVLELQLELATLLPSSAPLRQHGLRVRPQAPKGCLFLGLNSSDSQQISASQASGGAWDDHKQR